jgi:hypothetical protein
MPRNDDTFARAKSAGNSLGLTKLQPWHVIGGKRPLKEQNSGKGYLKLVPAAADWLIGSIPQTDKWWAPVEDEAICVLEPSAPIYRVTRVPVSLRNVSHPHQSFMTSESNDKKCQSKHPSFSTAIPRLASHLLTSLHANRYKKHPRRNFGISKPLAKNGRSTVPNALKGREDILDWMEETERSNSQIWRAGLPNLWYRNSHLKLSTKCPLCRLCRYFRKGVNLHTMEDRR